MHVRISHTPNHDGCEPQKPGYEPDQLLRRVAALEGRVALLEAKVEERDEHDLDRAVQRNKENRGEDLIDKE